jgi:hypothetical protein
MRNRSHVRPLLQGLACFRINASTGGVRSASRCAEHAVRQRCIREDFASVIPTTRPAFALRHIRGMIPRRSAPLHFTRFAEAGQDAGGLPLFGAPRPRRAQRTLVRSEKASTYQACSMCDASRTWCSDLIPSYPGLDLVPPMMYGSRGRFNRLSYGAKIQCMLFEPQSAALTSDCMIDCSVELEI